MVRVTANVIEVEGKTVVEHPDPRADCELAVRVALETLSASKPGPRIVFQCAVGVPVRVQNCAMRAMEAAGYEDILFRPERSTDRPNVGESN